MTNYNERLDEILSNFRQSSLIINANNSLGAGEKGREAFIQSIDDTKQAITSLIKELVAEAKPHKRLPDDSPTADEDLVNYGYNEAINQFEQNLLKALEEVE